MAFLARKWAALPPVAKAAATSCTIMACSDVMCQRFQQRNKVKRHDWARTARFATIGATLHGWFFFLGYRQLDAVFGPSTSLATAVKKTAVGQVTMFPVYLAAFFMYMSTLEGKSLPEAMDKLKASFVSTYMTGNVFWPVANVLNFRYCPPAHRVLCANVCGLMWNTILSWINSRELPVTVSSSEATATASSKSSSNSSSGEEVMDVSSSSSRPVDVRTSGSAGAAA